MTEALQVATSLQDPEGLSPGASSEEPNPSIQPSELYLQRLQGLVHSTRRLESRGYVFRQLSQSEVEKKERCGKCHRRLERNDRKRRNRTAKNKRPSAQSSEPNPEPSNGVSLLVDDITSPLEQLSLRNSNKSQAECRFHSGTISNRKWTCCNGSTLSAPCSEQEFHEKDLTAASQLKDLWRFYQTPPSNKKSIRTAIVLDCEMGVAESGESELIRLSVVDFFTCEVLVDSLVWPENKMSHFNTRFSGITRQAMVDARKKRTCIFGKMNARRAVWKFANPGTIVIGHSAQNDLTSLRWIHQRVIDTQLVESDMTGAHTGLSLKTLAQIRLNTVIQDKRTGHDSLEDAITTRNLLHWNMTKILSQEEATEHGQVAEAR